jgi:predicted phosphohydrolase
MNFQYISDTHIEFFNENQLNQFIKTIKPLSDICILAGDIGNPFLLSYKIFLNSMSLKFKKIFLISGNHEYYYNDLIETIEQIKNIIKTFKNISFLDNSFEDYQNIRWIGTTQWTKIIDTTYSFQDRNLIKNMTINKYNELHIMSIDFLTKTLIKSKQDNIYTIIITHHLPLYELIDKKYKNIFNAKYNQYYYAELDELIKKYNSIIKCWVYGHAHIKSIKSFYNVKFLCNPVGYIGENSLNEINEIFNF